MAKRTSHPRTSTPHPLDNTTIFNCSTYGLGGVFRAQKGSKFSLTRVHVSNCIAWLSGGAVNVEDIVDKLERGAELLETGAIAMALLSTSTANAGVQSAIASP